MVGVTGYPLDVAAWAVLAGTTSPPPLDPTAVFDLPGPVRGTAAFVLVLLLGGLLVRRFEPFLERSVEASMDRPLASVGYGVAAHAVIAFGGVYLANQLTQAPTGGWNAGVVGVAVGMLLALLAAALGFTVVGSTVAGLWLEERRWAGPVVGALFAGVAATLDPPIGWLLWFVVVSMGIGGPARKWLHASEGPEVRGARRD